MVPGKAIAEAAEQKFGKEYIRYDHIPPKVPAPEFPVRTYDGKNVSSQIHSQILARMPEIEVDSVFCEKSIYDDAIQWRKSNESAILGLQQGG